MESPIKRVRFHGLFLHINPNEKGKTREPVKGLRSRQRAQLIRRRGGVVEILIKLAHEQFQTLFPKISNKGLGKYLVLGGAAEDDVRMHQTKRKYCMPRCAAIIDVDYRDSRGARRHRSVGRDHPGHITDLTEGRTISECIRSEKEMASSL